MARFLGFYFVLLGFVQSLPAEHDISVLQRQHQEAFVAGNYEHAEGIAIQLVDLANGNTDFNLAYDYQQYVDFYNTIRLIRTMEPAQPDDNLYLLAREALGFYAGQLVVDLRLVQELINAMVEHRHLAEAADQAEYLDPIVQAPHDLVGLHLRVVWLGHLLGEEHPVVMNVNREILEQVRVRVRNVQNDPEHLNRLADLLNMIEDPTEQVEELRRRAARTPGPFDDFVATLVEQYRAYVLQSDFAAAERQARELAEVYRRDGDENLYQFYINLVRQNHARDALRFFEDERTPELEAFRRLILDPEEGFEAILEDEQQQDLLRQIRQERDLMVRDTLIVQLLRTQFVMNHVIDAFQADIQQQVNWLEWLVGAGTRGLNYLRQQYRRMGWNYRANQLEANQNRLTADANWLRALVQHVQPAMRSRL